MLEWDAMAITSSGNFRDRYQVFITNGSDLAELSLAAPVFDTGAEGELAEPTNHMLNLADLGFQNETIYVSFRNFTQGLDGNELAIDNISVSTTLSAGNQPSVFEQLVLQPNPSSTNTTLNFGLKESAESYLEVVDITGKVLSRKNLGVLSNGNHSISLERDGLADGIYIVRLRSDASVSVVRAVFN